MWPSLFGYQFLVEAITMDGVDTLLERTLESRDASRAVEAMA